MSTAIPTKIMAKCDCGKRYRVTSKHAGKRAKCPACNESFEVPSGSADSGQQDDQSWIDRAAHKNWEQERSGTKKVDHAMDAVFDGEVGQETVRAWWQDSRFTIAACVCAALVLLVSLLQLTLDGPTFVQVYLGIGVTVAVALLFCRATSQPVAVFLVLVISYEMIGLARYGYGLSQGMHRFGMLQSMLIYGPVGFFFVSVLQGGGGSSGGWGSSCSSGSSCGGGGCGGGGCGGCGG